MSTCRGFDGMGGVSPIPWTAVHQYGQRHYLDEDTFSLLEFGIMIIDAAHLETIRKKRDQKAKKVKSKKHGRRN